MLWKLLSAEGKKETSEQKKIQTTIYFYEEELVRIEEQTGRGKKEKDKSALVRSAVDMVLDIPDLEYSSLKMLLPSRAGQWERLFLKHSKHI